MVLEGEEEGVASAVEGVSVGWRWVAEGGDEEGAAEHKRGIGRWCSWF